MDSIFEFVRTTIARGTLKRAFGNLSNDNALKPVDRFDMREAGIAFMDAFQLALECPRDQLLKQLNGFPLHDAGYCFEGAALAIGTGAAQTQRWEMLLQFLQSADKHPFNTASGCGGAFMHAGLDITSLPADVDSFWRWLLMDGFAFHQSFFNSRCILIQQKLPLLNDEDAHAYHQGIGRAIWYAADGNPDKIREFVSYFHCDRHEDLWHGVALQASYCGGIAKEFRDLKHHAGKALGGLVTGTILGAVSRATADYMPDHTDHAVRIICDAKPQEVVELFFKTKQQTTEDGGGFLSLRERLSQAVLN